MMICNKYSYQWIELTYIIFPCSNETKLPCMQTFPESSSAVWVAFLS